MMKVFPYFDFVVYKHFIVYKHLVSSKHLNNLNYIYISKELKKDFNVYIKLFIILYAENKEDIQSQINYHKNSGS